MAAIVPIICGTSLKYSYHQNHIFWLTYVFKPNLPLGYEFGKSWNKLMLKRTGIVLMVRTLENNLALLFQNFINSSKNMRRRAQA